MDPRVQPVQPDSAEDSTARSTPELRRSTPRWALGLSLGLNVLLLAMWMADRSGGLPREGSAATGAAPAPSANPAEMSKRELDPERLLEQGKQVVTSRLPAVVGTVKDINEPRYPSFMGIRKAAKAAIPIWSAADVGCETNKIGEAGSATRWPAVYPLPAREGAAEMIEGTPEEIAAKLADKLIADKVI